MTVTATTATTTTTVGTVGTAPRRRPSRRTTATATATTDAGAADHAAVVPPGPFRRDDGRPGAEEDHVEPLPLPVRRDPRDGGPGWDPSPGTPLLPGLLAWHRLVVGRRRETWLCWSVPLWQPALGKVVRPDWEGPPAPPGLARDGRGPGAARPGASGVSAAVRRRHPQRATAPGHGVPQRPGAGRGARRRTAQRPERRERGRRRPGGAAVPARVGEGAPGHLPRQRGDRRLPVAADRPGRGAPARVGPRTRRAVRHRRLPGPRTGRVAGRAGHRGDGPVQRGGDAAAGAGAGHRRDRCGQRGDRAAHRSRSRSPSHPRGRAGPAGAGRRLPWVPAVALVGRPAPAAAAAGAGDGRPTRRPATGRHGRRVGDRLTAGAGADLLDAPGPAAEPFTPFPRVPG